MSIVWQDVRYAFRVLARSPAFTGAVVLTLALGIGINSSLFSVIHNVLLKPLPYPEPDRLVQVQSTIMNPGKPTVFMAEWSYPRFEVLREHNHIFTQIAACAEDLADSDARRRTRAGEGRTGVSGLLLVAWPKAAAWTRL